MDLKEVLKVLNEGGVLDLIARPIARRFGRIARSFRRYSYIGLAALFMVVIAANAIWETISEEADADSLDLAIRARVSSPRPDPRITILDVDERSLALLAQEHGRWPWPRSVLAEAIATVADAGARAVVLNVMTSDPDKGNSHADRVFDEVARATPNAVFPMIRLNPKNDGESEVRAGMLEGAHLWDPGAADTRIAVVIPSFPGTHDKLGVNNLVVDRDGAVRRYAVWWSESGFDLPSIALRAARLAGVDADDVPGGEIILNWRNKRGDYPRISFADYYRAAKGDGGFSLERFKDAVVIIGVSAPGIANTKGTPSSPVTDDNVILATAIDDIVHDTHLRVLPGWASALVSALLVLALAASFHRGIGEKSINRWFATAQSAMVVVTIGSASYTVYLADLSGCFLFALFYFFLAKLYALIDRNASRGMPTFAEISFDPDAIDRVVIFGFDASGIPRRGIGLAKAGLERRFGVSRIFHIDNAFGIENLFGGTCKGLEFFIVFFKADEIADEAAEAEAVRALFGETLAGAKISGFSDVRELSASQARDVAAIQREVGRALLRVTDRLINPQELAPGMAL